MTNYEFGDVVLVRSRVIGERFVSRGLAQALFSTVLAEKVECRDRG
jgi:hypothetical protein